MFPFSHYISQIDICIPNVPQEYFAGSFQGLWFAYATEQITHVEGFFATSWAQNHKQITHVEKLMMKSHFSFCNWCDDPYINLLLAVKASIYSFVNDQLIFLKCEQSNTSTSMSSERNLMTPCFFSCMIELSCCWIIESVSS